MLQPEKSSRMVQVIPKILHQDICQNLILSFENSDQKQRVDRDAKPRFTQVNLGSNPYLVQRVKAAIDIYKEILGPRSWYLPPVKYMEEFRVKKYDPETNDRFDEHVDVVNHATARRYLALLFYLNEVEEGGETKFPLHGRLIKPKVGSVLIFPPTWEYPHSGLPTISGSKYIMSTYLHYG